MPLYTSDAIRRAGQINFHFGNIQTPSRLKRLDGRTMVSVPELPEQQFFTLAEYQLGHAIRGFFRLPLVQIEAVEPPTELRMVAVRLPECFKQRRFPPCPS